MKADKQIRKALKLSSESPSPVQVKSSPSQVMFKDLDLSDTKIKGTTPPHHPITNFQSTSSKFFANFLQIFLQLIFAKTLQSSQNQFKVSSKSGPVKSCFLKKKIAKFFAKTIQSIQSQSQSQSKVKSKTTQSIQSQSQVQSQIQVKSSLTLFTKVIFA